MKIARKLLLSLFAMSPLLVQARQLSVSQALARLNASGAMRVAGKNPLQLVHTEQQGDLNLYYVLSRGGNNGFVILSADDQVAPLLGYTEQGSYDADEMPDAMRWWLGECAFSIHYALVNDLPMQPAGIQHAPVAPLVSAQWTQSAPFNNYCTELGYAAPSGCVATALAQIMHHHKFPEVGIGSMAYTVDGVYIESDFGKHHYDWANMLDNYEGVEYSQASADAVALLVKDCGVAVGMEYQTGGSGANSYTVPYALYTYFNYNRGIQACTRSFYSDEQWAQTILSELDANRPVYYSGSTEKNEGHAFVCDGYDGNGLFHFNWGWGQRYNGYFMINGPGALDPKASGTGGGTVGYGYVNMQNILIGLSPEQTGEPKPFFASSRGYTVTVSDDQTALNMTYSVGNYGTEADYMPDSIGICLEASNGTKYYEGADGSKMMMRPGFYANRTSSFSRSIPLADGTYKVYPAFGTVKVTGRKTTSVFKDYIPLPYGYEYTEVEVKDGKYTISNPGGVTDGIKHIEESDADVPEASSAYYDLSGRRVITPTQGLYIHKGKKVLVK